MLNRNASLTSKFSFPSIEWRQNLVANKTVLVKQIFCAGKRQILFALPILLALTVQSLLFAADSPESYESRPDILKVRAAAHPDLPASWHLFKAAQLNAVALYLEMYPDFELYFLARDAEYLFDLTKLIVANNPDLLKRIHLINVSREQIHSPLLRDYLAQEGISEESLKTGKKILLIDGGKSGTIPIHIQSLFPANLRPQIRSHFLCSVNSSIPSTRSFLAEVLPASVAIETRKLHPLVIDYEGLPHYTEKSDHYERINDRTQPISTLELSPIHPHSHKEALRQMEDLRYFVLHSDSTLKEFQERRLNWRKLKSLTLQNDRTKLLNELETLIKSKAVIQEAIVRDFIDLCETGAIPLAFKPITLNELGLPPPQIVKELPSNNEFLIHKYPEWRKLFTFPKEEIPALIKKKDFKTLKSVASVIQSEYFLLLLSRALGERTEKEALDLIITLIRRGNPWVHQSIVYYNLSPKFLKSFKKVIKFYLARRDKEIIDFFLENSSKFPVDQMQDLVRDLITYGDEYIHHHLVLDFFSRPEAANYPELHLLLIKKASPEVRAAYAQIRFKPRHALKLKPIFRELIQLGEDTVLKHLVKNHFSRPYSASWLDLFEKLILTRRPETHKQIALICFAQDHWARQTDLFLKFIENAHYEALWHLEYETLPKLINNPRHQKLAEVLLKLVIAKRGFHEFDDTMRPVRKLINIGNQIKTHEGKSFRVMSVLQEGRLGTMLLIKAIEGEKQFVLRLFEKPLTENEIKEIESMHKVYQSFEIPHARMIELHQDYMITERIEGETREHFIAQKIQTLPTANEKWTNLLRKLSDAKILKDRMLGLQDKDFIWNGSDWIVAGVPPFKDLPPPSCIRETLFRMHRTLKTLKNPFDS